MSSVTERLNTALAGRYRIERQLGQGGMATVYLALDLKHDRQVAVKVLKPELAAVLGPERFVVEIKTTASLQHPHILPLFDSGSADGFLFYVMPYIEGETLRSKLDRETQFGVEEAVRITMQVADALDYAHRRGIIHRDIKPENILLHDGRPMVADFGIALAVSAAAGGRMTETGLSLGTPHYMSPEQATADKEITARADIYSLGSVLFEMLTGNPPHTGANAQQIIMKIITETAAPVTKYRKAVPANVAGAVARSLETLPADRFESARAFADALGNTAFRNDVTTVAGEAASRRAGGNRWLMLAAGVVLLAAGIGLGALLTRRAPVSPQVVRFVAPMKSQRLYRVRAADAPFALSPDGTRLAYTAFDSGASTPTLHVRSLDQFTSTSFPGSEGALTPFFSPDGLWIGFVTAASGMNKVAVSGGPVTPVIAGVEPYNGAPSWGDDHSIVYSVRGILTRARDGGGAPATFTDSSKLRVISPSVLPGSKALLAAWCPVSAAGCTAGVGVIDAATGAGRVLVPGATRGWYLPSGHLVYATAEGALFAVKFDVRSFAIGSAPVAVLDGFELGSNALLPRVAISPSGTLAYVPVGTTANAVVVQVDRAGREQVIVAKPGSYTTPRLSPDGGQLALGVLDAKERAQIWIHDRSSGTTRQLTFNDGNVRPTWSPDGKRIAFSGQRADEWHVLSMAADGSGTAERMAEGKELTGSAAVSWSRDGKWVVVDGVPEDSKTPGNEDIFAIPTSGPPRTLRPAVSTPFDEQSGEVSPDGKWIAYVSNDAGKPLVYVQPFLTPGGRTLISEGGALEPVWVSNNELVYLNGETDSLTSARLEFGAATKVTRTALFDRRPYRAGTPSIRQFDVSRDGKTFIFVKPLGNSAVIEPIIVLNWMEEVKRLMAAAGIR